MEGNKSMTKSGNRAASIFPSSGNDEADAAWAELVAGRDLELLCWGTDEHLRETLHAITGSQKPSAAETAYFVAVLRDS